MEFHAPEFSVDQLVCVCQHFIKSYWNADLFSPEELGKCQTMFSWKPTENGFEQLPINIPNWESDWTKLCSKVGSENINQLLV
jgi:hypothetical protein